MAYPCRCGERKLSSGAGRVMTSTTFNALLVAVLDNVTPNVFRLFSEAREDTTDYIELDPSRDRSVPHLAADGSIIYTEYFGIIIIFARNETDLLSHFDEVIADLKSYGFHVMDFDDDERSGGAFTREMSVKVLC